jgi:hypothetical protein
MTALLPLETQEAIWLAEEAAARREGLEMCQSCLGFVKPDDLVFERCLECWGEWERVANADCGCQQCLSSLYPSLDFWKDAPGDSPLPGRSLLVQIALTAREAWRVVNVASYALDLENHTKGQVTL